MDEGSDQKLTGGREPGLCQDFSIIPGHVGKYRQGKQL